ncbi:MAG: NUDIX domain-containing protein [Opitutales bacterium]|nr:NUDIX domain-containing protein [Opitutales bacterium]
MERISAGLLMYEGRGDALRVLIVHPAGPYAKKKDIGHWSIPKGEIDEGEDLLTCARREFREETGHDAGEGPFIPLGSIRQKGGKLVHCWAFEGHWDEANFSSNSFEMEWPPKSGRVQSYPEVDRAEMLPPTAAKYRIKETQRPFIDRLEEWQSEAGR